MICNPYFEKIGVNAVVMPMGVKAEAYPTSYRRSSRLTNIRGALITMPHKVATLALMDELSVTAKIAGACNAILLRPDGTLLGDMFDGEGFVRGMHRKGREAKGARALVVGSGGVGSAIAASLAGAGVSGLGLFDMNMAAADSLAGRLRLHYPDLPLEIGSKDAAGYDIVVNATPIGMSDDDPLPIEVDRIASSAFVGEVVLKQRSRPSCARRGPRAATPKSVPICCSSNSRPFGVFRVSDHDAG